MALKMNNVYCGDGFPNLPDFKDLSGGGSGGSAAVMAGQAIRISDIRVSNVSYKRINANVDDLTIAVDGVTNKLKSLVKGLYNFSTTEFNTGQKWVDGKDIFCKTVEYNDFLTIGINAWTNLTGFSSEGIDTPIMGIAGAPGATSYPINVNVGTTLMQAMCARAAEIGVKTVTIWYTKD